MGWKRRKEVRNKGRRKKRRKKDRRWMEKRESKWKETNRGIFIYDNCQVQRENPQAPQQGRLTDLVQDDSLDSVGARLFLTER